MKKLVLLNLMMLLLSWGINAQTATQPAGTGTSTDPYKIASLENLYWMTYSYSEWNKYFIQTADIDASATSGWWTDGWVPIGDTGNGVFSGFYDGNGHTISGLNFGLFNQSISAADIGFFGLASGATIQNLGLINVNFNADQPYNTCGALVGYASGNVTINNCYSTGVVKGYWFSGGLVGKISTSSTVRNSYSTCNVSGYQFTGGLIGLCQSNVSIVNCFHTEGVVICDYNAGGLIGSIGNTSISKCHSEGEVTGSNNAGGLVGWSSESEINNSYSRCSVTTTSTVNSCGGLVGAISGQASIANYQALIANCYSTGSVYSGMGGLVGSQSGDVTITNSFWDTQTSGTASSAGGTAKTTDDMLTQSTFTSTNWDFTNTWHTYAGCNDGYPILIPATLRLSSESDNQTICAGTEITPIVYAVDGLVSGVSLSVDPSSGLSGIFDLQAKTFTISGTPTGAGTYSFTVTTSGILSPCIDATATGNINVNPLYTPSVTITSSDADNVICPGTNVIFTATPLNLGGGTVSYTWKKNGITVGSDQSTYDVSTLANGDAVSCVITVAGGTCLTTPTATSNAIVTTFHSTVMPSVTISSSDADNTICKGTEVTFSETVHNLVEGGVSLSWKKNGVAVGCYRETYTTADLADGDEVTCEITLMSTNCLDGQTATSNAIVTTVNSLPTAGLSSSDPNNTVCEGGELTFTASGAGESGTYEFFVDDVSQGTASATATFTPGTLTNGQVVTVQVTNANGCSAISDGITTIVNPLPKVSITNNNSPICYDYDATFELEGTPGAEVTYSFDGGITTWNVSLSSIGGTATVTRIEASSDVTLSLIGIKMNSPGCDQALTSTSTVIVNNPSVSISGDHEACTSTTLTAVTDASDPSYLWGYSEGADPEELVGEGSTLDVSQSGNYWLLVSDGMTGCFRESDAFAVTINPLPTVNITGNTEINVGETTTLSPTTGGTWESSSDAVATVTDAGVVTGKSDGTAIFTFTDAATGCSATTEFQIKVSEPQNLCTGSAVAVFAFTDTDNNMNPQNATGDPDDNSAAIGNMENVQLDLTGGSLTLGDHVTVNMRKSPGNGDPTVRIHQSQDGQSWTVASTFNVTSDDFTGYNVNVSENTRYISIENISSYWLFVESVTFNYPCPECTDGTLTLISNNNLQSVCLSSAASDVVYMIGGGATGATVDGLPDGMSWNFVSGTLTINGTPIESGTFDYTVTTTGISLPCAEATATGTITVNAPPKISDIIPSTTDPIAINALFSITVSYADVDNNVATAVIDWGDGSQATDILSEAADQKYSHTYTDAGVYTITASVDDGCGTISKTYQYVVVYDPSAGFVTGGGWIESPICVNVDPAYDYMDVSGTANFDFVAKYLKGKQTPDGSTEFQFKAGGLNFKSTDYEWLIIADSKAMFKGSGTINGSGDFGFMLSAVDADLTESTDVDLFRIKIWDKDNGDAVVYDNQCGADDYAYLDQTTKIAGGSIVIHSADKKKKSAEIIEPILEQSNLKVYPNPFSDRLKFEFTSPANTHVRIDIYDLTGRRIRNVFNDQIEAETKYTIDFIPKNTVSGMYIYRIIMGESVFNGKVTFKGK